MRDEDRWEIGESLARRRPRGKHYPQGDDHAASSHGGAPKYNWTAWRGAPSQSKYTAQTARSAEKLSQTTNYDSASSWYVISKLNEHWVGP